MRFSRKIVARLITLAAALAVIVSVATPAHASLDYSGDYNVVHMENGYCLDSNSGYSVYMLPCNGGNYQLWDVTATFDGTCVGNTCGDGYDLTLKDVATGYCLDSNGTSVYTHACGGAYQTWSVYGEDDTLTQDATGLCLDGSGTNVYILSCNGGAFQNWEET
jgi:hypothetical protein